MTDPSPVSIPPSESPPPQRPASPGRVFVTGMLFCAVAVPVFAAFLSVETTFPPPRFVWLSPVWSPHMVKWWVSGFLVLIGIAFCVVGVCMLLINAVKGLNGNPSSRDASTAKQWPHAQVREWD